MAIFHEVIVAYDVADTRIRSKLLETLKDYGLVSIQKSVMWGQINWAEHKAIQAYLAEVLEEGDKGFVVPVTNAAEQIQANGSGYQQTLFLKVDEHLVV